MFWELERVADTGNGVYDASAGSFLPYSAILAQSEKLQRVLAAGTTKLLVALVADNSAASIVGYLAALRSGHAVLLLNAATAAPLQRRILDAYLPEVVLSPASAAPAHPGYVAGEAVPAGLTLQRSTRPSGQAIHEDTALLLSTSGTTGSPKCVRLSYDNIGSNATSIRQYLRIDDRETAITTLPLAYSYGLSVVNSHLAAGAGIVCCGDSVLTPGFWQTFVERRCTSLAGVPATYAMLERLRFADMSLPSLRTMTQAGGRLAPEKVTLFAEIARRKGIRFYVMYGQTEASPRIAYVPPERVHEKPASIGIPIPGGALRVEAADAQGDGELVYEGPNVMLGYALGRECLGKGDELHGRLRTGDIGRMDADGFFCITGRLKRFLKVAGLRVNLDEVESTLESALSKPVACFGNDDLLQVVVESGCDADAASARRHVVERYGLHHSFVRASQVDNLPLNSSGKKNYGALAHVLG